MCDGCDHLTYTGCIDCVTGRYKLYNLCEEFCPTGYTMGSGVCDPDSTQGFVFDITLSQIEDIVTDTQSSIPVLTGTTTDFYPDYNTDDPYAAYQRGYYFHGAAVMQLPPHS